VAYLGGNRHDGHQFQLSAGPWTQQDFAPGSTLHVWEFGAGDTCRINTGVSVRRLDRQGEDAVYEVLATTPVTLTVPGKRAMLSRDGTAWLPAKSTPSDGHLRIELGEELIDRGVIFLKW